MRSDAYGRAAQYYDFVYSWKNYRLEAAKLRLLIDGLRGKKGGSLLDVACGTGGHLRFLREHYETVGVDLSAEMLRVARRKFRKPVPRLVRGDMRTVTLPRRFDAVICLYSAIAYLRNERELKVALRNFARHLEPGGVLIIEPFVEPSKFKPESLTGRTVVKRAGLEIERVTSGRRRGNRALFDFELTVTRKTKRGRRIELFSDHHELTMFSRAKYLAAMKHAGFSANFLAEGLTPARGLFVGTKA